MKFNWDEKKDRANKAKHGISFSTAVMVFTDPQRIEKFDLRHSENEDRWVVLGLVAPNIFVVIYQYCPKG